MARRRSSNRVNAILLNKNTKNTNALASVMNSKRKKDKSVIDPPYDPEALYRVYENSSLLQPNVEAYITNIDSFGHHFIPSIDISVESSQERLRDAIHYERYVQAQTEGKAVEIDAIPEPTEQDIDDRRELLKRTSRIEYAKTRAFFKSCCQNISFVELRRRSRKDLEVTGNAYWEILRNVLGEIKRLIYVRPHNMRLTVMDVAPTEIEDPVKITDITWVKEKRRKRFRRIVEIDKKTNTPAMYFKEFGDPRTISRKTGTAYKDAEALEAKEKGVQPATELIHFKIFTPNSVYGVPRWIATLPAILGTRELDEVNLNYFKNNVVPPLALLVSGGRFTKGVASRIEEFIDEHMKGKKGLHRILVLEAEGQKAAGETGPKLVPRIQFVPLRDAQQQDALFQEYDKRNEEKVAQAFRVPRFLRGDDTQTNRATAFATLRFAEEQVFNPERSWFDNIINTELLGVMDIKFWEFRSNSPVTRDPEQLTKMIIGLVQVGVLVPDEARELASDAFNRTLIKLGKEWTNRPLPLTLAQLKGGDVGLDMLMQPKDELVIDEPPRSPSAAPKMPGDKSRRAGQPVAPLGPDVDDSAEDVNGK